jgi:hypothetical protein
MGIGKPRISLVVKGLAAQAAPVIAPEAARQIDPVVAEQVSQVEGTAPVVAEQVVDLAEVEQVTVLAVAEQVTVLAVAELETVRVAAEQEIDLAEAEQVTALAEAELVPDHRHVQPAALQRTKLVTAVHRPVPVAVIAAEDLAEVAETTRERAAAEAVVAWEAAE